MPALPDGSADPGPRSNPRDAREAVDRQQGFSLTRPVVSERINAVGLVLSRDTLDVPDVGDRLGIPCDSDSLHSVSPVGSGKGPDELPVSIDTTRWRRHGMKALTGLCHSAYRHGDGMGTIAR